MSNRASDQRGDRGYGSGPRAVHPGDRPGCADREDNTMTIDGSQASLTPRKREVVTTRDVQVEWPDRGPEAGVWFADELAAHRVARNQAYRDQMPITARRHNAIAAAIEQAQADLATDEIIAGVRILLVIEREV